MRVLAVSDVVREILYTPAVRTHCTGVELILSCGDLPADYLEYLVTLLNVPLLYVHGNHDRPTHRADGTIASGPRGGVNADARVTRVSSRSGQPLIVAGLEGSHFYNGGPHQYTEREMHAKARRLSARLLVSRIRHRHGLDVLITHAAPAGIHDGTDRAHQGFHAFRKLIERWQPRWAIHGHVHPSYGYDTAPREVGRTTVVNVFGYEIMEIAP
ncbi:MAG: metallophosphoesterase family protein [Candidatus Bipolaricaulota bacterium]|nr:MAG: metallophosphoesterase family protein [Candidatus Bipolaricaulota bacterium]